MFQRSKEYFLERQNKIFLFLVFFFGFSIFFQLLFLYGLFPLNKEIKNYVLFDDDKTRKVEVLSVSKKHQMTIAKKMILSYVENREKISNEKAFYLKDFESKNVFLQRQRIKPFMDKLRLKMDREVKILNYLSLNSDASQIEIETTDIYKKNPSKKFKRRWTLFVRFKFINQIKKQKNIYRNTAGFKIINYKLKEKNENK